MKKVEKPLVEEKKETNGGGSFGHGSGVLDTPKEKEKFKITKSAIIIIAIVAFFVLALIIL